MPTILKREGQGKWLTGRFNDARSVLALYNPILMLAHEVTTWVNTPEKYDLPLIEVI